MAAQFVLGIDLGTTNTVMGYSPLDEDQPTIELLAIPQVVGNATVESRNSLPSFLYLGTDAEAEKSALNLPWSDDNEVAAVGEFARRQAADVPDRTVGAAKSWLGHSKVDRHQDILPWGVTDGPQVSPVEASRRYLAHVIAAWDAAHPEAPFAEQQVVLTVPASFDASARELTREAAIAAGLPEDLVLLEEPQAAVYSWLDQTGDDWRKVLSTEDTVLVCDVGGGTTDLTLVTVSEEDGELVLQRQAVGNHLLVGGDNMDLALAHHAAELFAKQGTKLDAWQSVSLWHACRAAKETLFAEDGPEKHTISIKGRGSKLIGGSVSVEIDRKKIAKLLRDGFFPACELNDRPARQRMSGFQEIGLPFEAETAVTKHVAAFLSDNGTDDGPSRPTRVLFNGGVFKADTMSRKLLDVMKGWFDKSDAPAALDGVHDLDFAVARGAAYYGWAKKHGGVRIRGGTARSYYVGIETAGLAIPGAPRPLRALCVVPHGMEEGTEVEVPSGEFGLVVGESAPFRFFSSTHRRDDQPGDLLQAWTDEELTETDSLEVELPKDDGIDDNYVPVKFHSKITELGMFELWCVAVHGDSRWKLEFNVREEE